MARTKDPELEAQRRASVLDAVQALLAEESWTQMTLAAVARRAGVSKGVVTYWFPTKDELIIAAVERFHVSYAERLVDAATTTTDPRARMRALIEVAFPSRAQVTREVRFQAEVWSFAKSNAAMSKKIRDAYASFRTACEALIHVGTETGYITTNHRADLQRSVHALIDGLSVHVAFDPKADIREVRELVLFRVEQWFHAS